MFHRIHIDALSERVVRGIAQRTSRRSLLAALGTLIVGAPLLPLLPVSRKAHAAVELTDFAKNAQTTDATLCTYWRYCASDGYMCSCCGGGAATCPPGSYPSPTGWVGSCLNPADNRMYLIAYRDCCGKDSCGRCACLGLDGEMPAYRVQANNDVVWCFGAGSMVYHCSSAAVIGLAE